MLTFKVLSTLLLYPTRRPVEEDGQMVAILMREGLVSSSLQDGLKSLIDRLSKAQPLAAEAEYVSLFDNSRALSLHLFEHVHGDSRERGAAMSDLIEQYRNRGLEISADELPDYLPLFLEFLSLQPVEEARAMLAEVADILALLQVRLEQRSSDYAVVLRSLCAIAGTRIDIAAVEKTVASEKPIDIDKDWEEAPVRFDLPLDDQTAADCQIASAMVQRMEQEIKGGGNFDQSATRQDENR